jgi:Hypothetical protein (DUF2513)
MQRDMNLIRQIMFTMETQPGGFPPRHVIPDRYSPDQISYHIWLLGQAGLMKVVETTTQGSNAPQAVPVSLTWEGHDFIDAARNDST